MANEFFIATNFSPAMMIRLERIRRGRRQQDLARKAGVIQAEISALRGLYIILAARRTIVQTLDLNIEDEYLCPRYPISQSK